MSTLSGRTSLDTILSQRRATLRETMARCPLSLLEKQAAGALVSRDFKKAIQKNQGIQVIAEFKRASPSAGPIHPHADPNTVADAFAAGGAAAISILTEEQFFQGSLGDLQAVRRQSPLPLLRKDFVIDSYQIYEAKAAGADAILLIVAILSETQLREMIQTANRLGVTPLVEVHTAGELDQALTAEAEVIGINNRDLQTLAVDIRTVSSLVERVPEGKIIIAESGFEIPEQVKSLLPTRVSAVLIGEALMRAPDIAVALRAMLQAGRRVP